MSVKVSWAPGLRLLAAADGSCASGQPVKIQAGQLTDVGAISVPTVLANRGNPCSCRRFEGLRRAPSL